MQFQISIQIKSPERRIDYRDKILLIGSCFTEHIGNSLADSKFSVLQNPNGILFDPVSVCKNLLSYIENKQYNEADMFQLNEVWHSWQHHSRFSNINLKETVENINTSQQNAHKFLKEANWIIITLGSSFSYRLVKQSESSEALPSLRTKRSKEVFGEIGSGVANCHRAPSQWFNKHLLKIEETISMLDNCYGQLMQFNPGLNIILTVSPVRHVRDGVIENNRSKARLIESVHYMTDKYKNVYYFPAYELVIDVLRDYRFYDIDLAHPTYMATEFVLEKFSESFIDGTSQELMQEMKKIAIARKHKAFQSETKAHQQFLINYFEKVKTLKEKYPFLNLEEELIYFSQT
jgi:GSCFA family